MLFNSGESSQSVASLWCQLGRITLAFTWITIGMAQGFPSPHKGNGYTSSRNIHSELDSIVALMLAMDWALDSLATRLNWLWAEGKNGLFYVTRSHLGPALERIEENDLFDLVLYVWQMVFCFFYTSRLWWVGRKCFGGIGVDSLKISAFLLW